MSDSIPESFLVKAQQFFNRPVCQKGTKPLGKSIEIEIFIDDKGPATITKQGGKVEVIARPSEKPDLSFWIPLQSLDELNENPTEDLAEIGIALVKLLVHDNPKRKIKTKVHLGILGMLRKGYFGVIPLGGTTFMKHLASMGFGSIGKIKKSIENLRKG